MVCSSPSPAYNDDGRGFYNIGWGYYRNLGDGTKAISSAEGDRQLSRSETREVDFFAKFGEREAAYARVSNAYLLKGLGNKGLGNISEARANLKKAMELSSASLYAKTELEGLE